MVHELEFVGESEGRICVICKLGFDTNEKILVCPYCNSLFHEEHLIEWLKIDKKCPLCGKDFSVIAEKYDFLIKEQAKSSQPLDQIIPPFAVRNQNEYNVFFMRILPTIFGLFFALLPNILFSLTAEVDFAIYMNWITLVLSFLGYVVIYYAYFIVKNDITSKWNKISFREDMILITSKKLPSVEIRGDSIAKIILRENKDTDSSGSPNKYYLTFKIFTKKNKSYSFYRFYESRNPNESYEVYREIFLRVRSFYNVLIEDGRKSVGERLKDFLKNNWIIIIIFLVFHFAISIICILINYFVLV